ncbi:MAG: 2-oxoglutarate dehydrogenase complex dihydrolipoyllysine-residue succinyltransferase [Deltaproteobacteria bacterium]|jgi:2-oxoglutarate dehydrogenase E2 component (dihydrolipoamide succinyltransferase)|nr:2-oxoglutarate dehydrogenase complex dihydrolipoyllysine-residue succinyltransferase [Deltaproteobacteria bacterium]
MSDTPRTAVVVPVIGESITTAILASWAVKVGASVSAGQTLFTVDSDKASLEVPAPSSGVLVETLAKEGDEVRIGGTVGWIAAADVSVAVAQGAPAEPARAEKAAQTGPAARQAAASAGVDIQSVTGSGRGGRVTSADVAAEAAKVVAAAPAAPAAVPSTPAPAAISARTVGRTERVPMSRLRQTIARRLVEAQHTAAMLTTFNEVDMSQLMALRTQYQDRFVKRYGLKLGFMSFFVKAVIEALKEFPAVNAEIDESDPKKLEIVYKHFYNIGVAVSTDKGLMVPVLRDADQLSFAATEGAIGELAKRGRDGKLSPEDFADGTFTITNGGVFGSLMSTPILNRPQVGILGMHAVKDRPIAVNGQVVIRPMMYLALSYDHRIIDGREAVSFLVRVKELVENPERILLEV